MPVSNSWTYTWSITGLKTRNVANLQDVVVLACFRLEASDGETSAFTEQSVDLPAPGEPFVPYDQVTEAAAVAWVKAALDSKPSTRVALLEAEVRTKVELKRAAVQPEEKPLPWAEAE